MKESYELDTGKKDKIYEEENGINV